MKKTVVIAMSRGIIPVNAIDNSTKRNCLSAVKTSDAVCAKYIITCGGIFQPPDVQTIPIATLMVTAIKNILVFLNDVEDKEFGKTYDYPKEILSETKSLDTYQNVEFMDMKFRELEIEKDDEIIICADKFHYIRTKILFENIGYTNIKYSQFSQNDYECFIELSFKEKIKEIILICMAIYDPTGKTYWPIKQIMERERQKRKTGQVYLSY